MSLGRFKDIVLILLNFGFDDLVERLDLPGKDFAHKISKISPGINSYQRIRLALEKLGPTFIKLGQIMSVRSDFLPKPLIDELKRLQDEVEPVGFEEIRKIVENSLGKSLNEVFVLFEPEAVAAASLSQVHRAVLRISREAVAVKVQRPKIRNTIETDLNIITAIAQRLHEKSEDLKIYDLPEIVTLTRRVIFRELDFRREARFMSIARKNLADSPGVYVPRAYIDLCTEHLLVMEYIQGEKLKDLDLNKLKDPKTIAGEGLRASIKQIIEDGFFHADPHPGNLLITQEGVLALLDWGMIGRLAESDRFELIDFVYSVIDKDSDRLVDVLLDITGGGFKADRRRLERDLLDILDSHMAVPIKQLHVGQLVMDITDLLRAYQLQLPPNFFLMAKALLTAEGTAMQIYPDLNVIPEIEPQIRRVAAQRLKPGYLWKKLQKMVSMLVTYRGQMPRKITQIIEKIDQGDLSMRFEHQNLSGIQKTLENIFSRLTLGIIIAAMIISSSLVITTGVPPLIFGYPALGIIGYIISAVLGFWVIYNIIRSRRF
jgi:ubiquinone biosynthesis protein